MVAVGLQGLGAMLAPHADHDEAQHSVQQAREEVQCQALAQVLDLRPDEKGVDGLPGDEDRRQRDEPPLEGRREVLDLAVAVGMLLVRRGGAEKSTAPRAKTAAMTFTTLSMASESRAVDPEMW